MTERDDARTVLRSAPRLSDTERRILLAAAYLTPPCADTMSVRRHAGIDNMGAFHVALDNLRNRGLVTTEETAAVYEERGWRPKLLVTVTDAGKEALAAEPPSSPSWARRTSGKWRQADEHGASYSGPRSARSASRGGPKGGRCAGAVVDGKDAQTGRAVAKIISSGLQLRQVPTAEVREMPWNCEAHRPTEEQKAKARARMERLRQGYVEKAPLLSWAASSAAMR